MSSLLARAQSNLDQMIIDLQRLVEVESPSRDIEHLTQCAKLLAEIMGTMLGGVPMLVDSLNGPHVHWRGGGTPKVLVIGHYDTVFPLGTLALRPFQIVDGIATGPGVFDMKAGIIQAIYGLSLLPDLSGVEILFSSDEEIGSTTSRELIEQRALAAGAVLVLEPSADGGALKIARKGTGRFDVLIEGRASHAGLEPEKGINALVEMANQIPIIMAMANSDLGTTVTPTIASAGTADNVVPARAQLLVDVRVETEGEKERIVEAFANLHPTLSGAQISVSGGISRPPMASTATVELFDLACDCARTEGLGEIDGVAVGGGSDGNFTAAIGVRTLDGLGAVGGGAHADSEYVVVATMPARAAMIAALVLKLQ